MYAIFFATGHWKGADVMKRAMWSVAPFGEFAFRGRRADQLILGIDIVDYSSLRRALQHRFQNKDWVTIEQVREFVASDKTDFHTGQLKKPVLVPMETEGLIEADPATRKRPRTYPDGTKLRFL